MSRTTHHTTYAHRAGNCANHECARTSITIPKPSGARLGWARRLRATSPVPTTIIDLRYSAAVMAVPALDGARPSLEPGHDGVEITGWMQMRAP